jgi:putative redox protein
MKVELKRIDKNFHFEGIGESKIVVNIDGSEKIGGSNSGARPMELVLMALGSCGAMDIISILKKQRQEFDDFSIVINANRDGTKIPSIFTDIHVEFIFTGDLDVMKVEKAVNLSMQKYCSVLAMLEKSADITYSYKISGN